LYFRREGRGQGHLAGGTIIVNHGQLWRLTRGEERGRSSCMNIDEEEREQFFPRYVQIRDREQGEEVLASFEGDADVAKDCGICGSGSGGGGRWKEKVASFLFALWIPYGAAPGIDIISHIAEMKF
jgi:hypothetical protein